MSIQRPLGPIGHCSAKLRRVLEIDEEAALGRTVRVRKPAQERTETGNRWARAANFGVPGAFHSRFVSSDDMVTFHFEVQAVSKTANGGCKISTPQGSRRLASGAPAEHDAYIERPGAVERTITPASFDGYAARSSATEVIGDAPAIFSNIAPTQEERENYWRAVQKHERTPGPDRLTLVPEKASRAAWQRLAERPEIPQPVREVAAAYATAKDKRKTQGVELRSLGLDRARANKLVRQIESILGSAKGKHAVRLSEGRGGRSQYRLTAELPNGLDAAGHLLVTLAFCAEMEANGLMYVATIHAPDHHNDRRNCHLHVAFHDRPAKIIGDHWDFEITEPVPGQSGRVRYPHRQLKSADWSRDSDGGSHREHGRQVIADMRASFADLCNKELDRLGVTRKLHPGDLKSLGCDRTPQQPLGTRAAPLEAAGVPTVTGISNAELLWTALLHEAWHKAELRAKQRADLRRRLAGADRKITDTEVSAADSTTDQLASLVARFNAADAVLTAHDAELAEYDVTLLMARARPDKTMDTCSRILTAIDAGTANRADTRAAPFIAARMAEAQLFLNSIAAIDCQNAPLLTAHRDAVSAAQSEIASITTAAAILEREQANGRANAERSLTDSRAVLEALFKRIMTDDIPILHPDTSGVGYRVPGITRDEMRAASAPALAEMTQNRLMALAEEQTKRMHAAATIFVAVGLPELERAAQAGDAGMPRTLKHVRAYADHPIFHQALANARDQRRPLNDRRGSNPATIWSSLRDRFASPAKRGEPAVMLPSSTPTPSLAPAPAAKIAAASKPPEAANRDDAIQSLAAALLAEPTLRVVEREGHLIIDSDDAPDWRISSAVFGGEPSVRAAAQLRFDSPWLDISAVDRERLLDRLGNVLRGANRRPLVKIDGEWSVDLADDDLKRVVERWQGYDGLNAVLGRADRHWRVQEDRSNGVPTTVRRPVTPERARVSETKGGPVVEADSSVVALSTAQISLAAARLGLGR